MLEDIIDSKSDSAVLAFFLAAPERSFSVMEISKRLGLKGATAKHSLNVLAAEGIVKTFAKKGKRYFLINSKYKLLPEIKNLRDKKAPPYKDELFDAIKRLGEIKAAFLSGVFTGYPTLPVDLLLVGKVNLNKLANFLKAAEKLMGQEINYSIMTVEEFHIRHNTFDRFIRDIFDYRHVTVVNELQGKKKK